MPTTTLATGAYAAAKNLLASSPAKSPLAGNAGGAAPTSFGQMLAGALDGVADSGRKAETQALSAVSGKGNLVDVVTAVAESETALQTLVAVRDRVISAYEEIMRMQV